MDFIRITKRDNLPQKREILITLLAIALSIVFAGLILLIFGLNPFHIFKEIIMGSLGTELRIKQTIVKAVPLIITSLGIIVAFKMKFWNIGAEGQITMGALGASWVALNLSPDMPKVFMILLMILAAAVCGGIWAFIPAIFKAKLGTNETIFTLMLNYVAIKFVTYLQYGPWRDPSVNGFPRVESFSENAILPSFGGIHIGWILAIIATVAVYFFMNHTKRGYEIAVVGESIETARYAGMNISKIIVVAMLISGGLCGITGMIQVSAVEKTLVFGVANGYGFTAIITAWLSKLNAGYALIICTVFAMLVQGGDYIQIALGVSSAVADIVQGLILFFVLGSEFFMRYKVHFGRNTKEVA
ncbi:MAG: ABC transporter permease [Anaerovoracaceae bacterium]